MNPVTKILSVLALISALMPAMVSCGAGSSESRPETVMNGDSTQVPSIEFNTLTHDFGVVTEGEKIACLFTFTNTGEGSLVINSASVSCGCTVPQFSKIPLRKGEKGTLEVIFNTSGYGGMQTKTITVQSNASTPVVVLAIKADVRSEIN